MDDKKVINEVKCSEEYQSAPLHIKENFETSENTSETSTDAINESGESVLNKLKQNGELDATNKVNVEKTETVEKDDSKSTTERLTRGIKRKANELEKNAYQKNDTKSNEGVKNDEHIKDNSLMKVVPEIDLMGKGKRARIPNKRYSDILLPTIRRSTTGQTKQLDTSTPENSVTDEETVGGRSSNTTNSSAKKTKTVKENIPDRKLLEPFKYGWVRELVWRKTSTQAKPIGDVYYYTPFGHKMRSIRDLMKYLQTNSDKQLQIDNFSFNKVPLNPDNSDNEIIRKAIDSRNTNNNLNVFRTNSMRTKLRSDDEKEENSEIESIKPTVKKTVNNRGKTKISPKRGGKAAASKKGKTSTPKLDELMDVDITPPPSKPPPPPTTSTPKSRKLCEPCSLRCDGLQGIIPTLQCRKCLCLYHHECVGTSTTISISDYVCQNCHQEPSTTDVVAAAAAAVAPLAAPPPLTPINTLKSVTTPHSTATLPKLQRIPRPDTTDPVPLFDSLPTITSVNDLPQPQTPPPPPVSSSLVSTTVVSFSTNSTSPLYSSVETSKMQDKLVVVEQLAKSTPSPKLMQQKQQQDTKVNKTHRPQYVEYLGGRKFLVIPKYRTSKSTPPLPPVIPIPMPINQLPVEANISNNHKLVSNNISNIENSEVSSDLTTTTTTNSNISNSVFENESDAKNESKLDEEGGDSTSMLNKNEDDDDDDDDNNDDNQSDTDNNDDCFNESNPKQNNANAKKRNFKLRSMTNNAGSTVERIETKFMENYLQNLSFGYNTMLYVFQYLKVQDLLRAGCVCTMWRDIASHPSLWRTVRMKNSQVHSFEGLANALKKHGTVYLDLRKMLLPSNGDDIWPEFSQAIARVDTLRKIELCRCPANVIEKLAQTNPNLEIINAVTIKCESINLDPLKSLKNIIELRLRSTSGITTTSIEFLSQLQTLKHLSLTSVNDLYKLDLKPIGDLINLESLDLGECTDFPKTFGEDILIKLEKLEKLRLEKGQGTCHTFELLNAIKNMKNLEQLELVNFDVKSGFDKALGACSNIKKLMIIPTYISQSATTNNMVLAGVLRLEDTLTHFVWGVTLELLRVTELFVDQCEEPKEKKDKKPPGNGDSIPVLKPVPDLSHGKVIQAASNPPQVEILPLPNLQKLLLNSLPTTRVKILKIPFHATWRQTLTDTV